MHSVNVYFGEKRGGCGDNRGYKNLSGLSELTKVASTNEPNDVRVHMGPPEAFHDCGASRVKSFVSDVIMTASHNFHSTIGYDYNLVCTMAILPPEILRVDEEFETIS
jgi:hypothetical protein